MGLGNINIFSTYSLVLLLSESNKDFTKRPSQHFLARKALVCIFVLFKDSLDYERSIYWTYYYSLARVGGVDHVSHTVSYTHMVDIGIG